MNRPNHEQQSLFPELTPPAPAEPVEVVVNGPFNSAHNDPYSTTNTRIARDLEIADEVHNKADEERRFQEQAAAQPSGRAALAGVRGKLERPEGWVELDTDEQLVNWAVPADGTVQPRQSRLVRS